MLSLNDALFEVLTTFIVRSDLVIKKGKGKGNTAITQVLNFYVQTNASLSVSICSNASTLIVKI